VGEVEPGEDEVREDRHVEDSQGKGRNEDPRKEEEEGGEESVEAEGSLRKRGIGSKNMKQDGLVSTQVNAPLATRRRGIEIREDVEEKEKERSERSEEEAAENVAGPALNTGKGARREDLGSERRGGLGEASTKKPRRECRPASASPPRRKRAVCGNEDEALGEGGGLTKEDARSEAEPLSNKTNRGASEGHEIVGNDAGDGDRGRSSAVVDVEADADKEQRIKSPVKRRRLRGKQTSAAAETSSMVAQDELAVARWRQSDAECGGHKRRRRRREEHQSVGVSP
jgi:hypothetical protein